MWSPGCRANPWHRQWLLHPCIQRCTTHVTASGMSLYARRRPHDCRRPRIIVGCAHMTIWWPWLANGQLECNVFLSQPTSIIRWMPPRHNAILFFFFQSVSILGWLDRLFMNLIIIIPQTKTDLEWEKLKVNSSFPNSLKKWVHVEAYRWYFQRLKYWWIEMSTEILVMKESSSSIDIASIRQK